MSIVGARVKNSNPLSAVRLLIIQKKETITQVMIKKVLEKSKLIPCVKVVV
jgi:hypothetical protein